jgi:hypothetical protein
VLIVARHLPERNRANIGHSAADRTNGNLSDRHTSSPDAVAGAEK